MGRVIHFEILADDPELAAVFYEAALGWKVERPEGMEQYWLLTTGEEGEAAINGGLMARHFPQADINTLDVPDLDEALQKIKADGGQVVHGPNQIPVLGITRIARIPRAICSA